MRTSSTFIAALAALALGACGSDEKASTTELPQGSEPAKLDPGDFSARIDNPYLPLAVGNRWVYRETGEGPVQQVVVKVLDRTRRMANGVRARVVHDRVSRGSKVIEDTYDWYAQDRDGNVWYLGEDTTEFAAGEPPSKSGSWEAGRRGAQPGIAMPARPKPGLSYRQEYFKGEAEDRGEVLRLSGRAKVPFGSFDRLLVTEDSTPLEPDATERKYYARGIGSILELAVSGKSRAELVSFTKGP